MPTSALGNLKQGIAPKLIFAVVLFSAVITLIISSIQLFLDYSEDISRIDNNIQQIRDVNLTLLTYDLWVTDQQAIETHLRGLSRLPDMQFLEVKNGDRVWATIGNRETKNIVARAFPMIYEFEGVKEHIGELTVIASLDGVYERLINKIVIILVSNGIKTFLVAGFILLFFQYVVTRHLISIAKFVESHNLGSLKRTLTLERKPGRINDELDTVVTAINSMGVNLSKSVSSLKQSEEKVRLLLNSTEESIVRLDLNGKCIFVNQASIRLLRYPGKDKLEGKDFYTTVFSNPAEDKINTPSIEHQGLNLRTAIAEGTTGHSDENIFWRNDGSSFPVEWWSHPIRENNRIVGAVLTFIDITERKASDREIQLYRDHLEQLVQERAATIQQQALIINQIHDSVIVTDKTHFIIDWNTGAENMYGYKKDEVIGQHISIIFPDRSSQEFFNTIIDRLEKTGSYSDEVIRQRKNGEQFHAHLSLSQRYDENGIPNGSIGLTVDISERKKSEVDARQKARELTVLNQELETFSYSVSHDLRTPLRSINGFSKLLLEDHAAQLNETGKAHLQHIINSTVRMSQLIDDLLQLSTVTRRNIKEENTNISNIAESIIENLRQDNPERNVECHIEMGMTTLGDKGLLKIALENIINNAWKYTNKKDHAIIELGKIKDQDPDLGYRDKNEHQNTLENGNDAIKETVYFVRDNGAGFNMAYADKLFTTFQRLHTKDEFPGTGVGLATVERIIHRHGGRIWANAAPGKGATFYFTLGKTG